jgi:hypothetical protein
MNCNWYSDKCRERSRKKEADVQELEICIWQAENSRFAKAKKDRVALESPCSGRL